MFVVQCAGVFIHADPPKDAVSMYGLIVRQTGCGDGVKLGVEVCVGVEVFVKVGV